MSIYFDSIVVPVDFSLRTTHTLKQAHILARLMNIDVTLVYVYDKNCKEKNNFFDKKDDNLSEKDVISRELDSLANKAKEKYETVFFPVLLEGTITESIVKFSKDNEARMIIMGNAGLEHAHNNQTLTPTIGSNTSQVIRRAECPVLTVNSNVIFDINNILVPINLDKPIKKKLNWVIYFARYFGTMIKVLSIIDFKDKNKTSEYEEKLNNIKKELNNNNIFCVTNLIITTSDHSETGKLVVDYAKENECDLIITMTQEEDKKNKMVIGETAISIIKYSENPVLSVTPFSNTDI